MASQLNRMHKFGAPLYCCAFLSEELLVVGGGGGKKSSGIPNQLVVARWAAGELSAEPVCTFSTGDEPPQRCVGGLCLRRTSIDAVARPSVALHPAGSTLVVALCNTTLLLRVHVGVSESGAATCELARLPLPHASLALPAVDVKCMAFSPDGTRLAVGSSDGRLRVHAWPSLTLVCEHMGAHTDAMSDVDFSPDGSLLLSTGNEAAGPAGGAAVWSVDKSGVLARLRWLPLPPTAKGRRTFRGCRFSDAASSPGVAFTGLNVGGEARILSWRTHDWALAADRRALKQPLTSISMSPRGRLLAVGGAEGGVCLLSAATLAPLLTLPSAHMVFVTAVAFAPSGSALGSVSGDASCRCTPAPPQRSLLAVLLRFFVYFLVYVAVVRLAFLAARHAGLLA